MPNKSPQQQLAEANARLAISQKYLARDDNPDLDPERQDLIDRNRLLVDVGSAQLSPRSAVRSRNSGETNVEGTPKPGWPDYSQTERYAALGIAAAIGFAIGAIWRS